MNADICYELTIKDPLSHTLHVTCKITDPDPAGQVIALAAWLPGSYKIRDFAKNVISMMASNNKKQVNLNKIEKNTWQVEPCTGELILTYSIVAFDTAPRGAYIDANKAFFDAARIFLQIQNKENTATRIIINKVKRCKWKLATTLKPDKTDTSGFGAYIASNYHNLIDHPVFMGELEELEFNIENVPHKIVLLGVQTNSFMADRLRNDVAQICQSEVALFGEIPKMRQYIFYLHVTANGYGGLEHRESSSLQCSRDSLPYREDMNEKEKENYRTLLGLFSHEYFHLWNVKRIRPSQLLKPDLSKELYSKELWIYEGITSYFDDFSLLLSKCINFEEYLSVLSNNINRLQLWPGRNHQSLEDSSFDAWIKFYQPEALSLNFEVSYYNKGAVVALLLDLELLKQSSGKCGLRQIMQNLWVEYGRSEKGLNGDQFESFVINNTGLDLGDFFATTIRSTNELDIEKYLNYVGIESSKEESSRLEQIGLVLSGCTVRNIVADFPANRAGLAPGDTLLAVANNKVTPDNIEKILSRVETEFTVAYFRDDMLCNASINYSGNPAKRIKLKTLSSMSDEQKLLHKAWTK